jgi:hypothetical protein
MDAISGIALAIGLIGLGGGHVADGYRDTGCDAAQQVQITNEAGEYLYSNNPTCPDPGGPSDAEIAALADE